MIYRGKWALVTGASAGIGATFARSLAAKGANIALTARRMDRLDSLAAEVKRDYAVETKVLPLDFTDPTAPQLAMDAMSSEGLPVDILVNNAGLGLPGFYTDVPWPAHRDFLELMVTSYAHFVSLALPGMQERGYGRIIQVASVAGLVPGSSGHTLYGASKAFLVSFSQSLAAECVGSNVKVSAVCPGFTYSEFHDVNNSRNIVNKLPKFMFMEAAPVVEGALRAVENGHVVFVPGVWNKFVVWLAKVLPRPWAAAMVRGQSRKFRRRPR